MVFAGDERWQGLDVPSGDIYEWREDSTYVQNPPFFQNIADEPVRQVTSVALGCWRSWGTR